MRIVDGFISRIQCLAVDSGIMPSMTTLENALYAMGADRLGHANARTLYTHLIETQRVLERWGQPPAVQIAGLFHSVYSTTAYRHQLLSYANRAQLRALIGSDAERLVYLFSSLSHSTVHEACKAINSYAAQEKTSINLEATSCSISHEELKNLMILHMANLAEQSKPAADGATTILRTLANMSQSLITLHVELPFPLMLLASAMTNEIELDVSAAYAFGVQLALSSPEKATVAMAKASELCPVLGEPILWQAFLAQTMGDETNQLQLANLGLARLRSFGVCWDRRRSFDEWIALGNDLLQPANAKNEVAYQFFTSTSKVANPGESTLDIEQLAGELDVRFAQYLLAFRSPATRGMASYPGLTLKSWWPGDQFPIVGQLEEAFVDIRREVESLQATLFHQEGERIRRTGSWDIFMLYERGKRIDTNCRLCPTITSIIEANNTMRTITGLIYLSRLAPGTQIEGHRGLTNLRLRCHLGIHIPPVDCALEVNGEEQSWKEGKCLVFDDYLPHRAWNLSDQERVVLIVDLWHPDLSSLEVELLKGLHGYTAKNATNLVNYWSMNENSRFAKRSGYD